MTTEGSYKSDRLPLELEAEIMRLKAQANIIWSKELRTLKWFGLRDAMSILEVGSGPGFTTELLLNALPNANITALDFDPVYVERADTYLQAQGLNRYTVVEGSVIDTKLPNNSFDFAYARFLYQHLPDPQAATRELFRVLKPGGILVIHDRDAGLKPIRAPENPIIDQVYVGSEQVQAAKGGNPWIGRKLWRIMGEAGFDTRDLELLAVHSDAVDVEPMLWFRPEVVERFHKQGVTSDEHAATLLQALATVNSSPDKYLLQPHILVAGQKPLQ